MFWNVRDCHFLPDWVGSRPEFTLTPTEAGGCDLLFAHHGLTPRLECSGQCSAGWNDYLAGLHDYVEAGAGRPDHRG